MFQDEIKNAQRGSQEALNYLIEKHRGIAFSIAVKYVKNRSAAEDVVQEAFIKVFLNIKKFRNESAFSTWLFRIVYNESAKYLEKEKKALRVADVEVEPSENVSFVKMYLTERSAVIKKAMLCLSPSEYMIINLFYLSEKGIKEIAMITNLSNENIKVLLYRARKKLAAFFEQNEVLKNSL